MNPNAFSVVGYVIVEWTPHNRLDRASLMGKLNFLATEHQRGLLKIKKII